MDLPCTSPKVRRSVAARERLRWILALSVGLVIAGCGDGTPVSLVRDCGSFDVGDRTYLATSEPAAAGGRCIVSAFAHDSPFVPSAAKMTITSSLGGVRATVTYEVPAAKIVYVTVERSGPSVPPELRRSAQACDVLLLDAGLQPVSPPSACVNDPRP
jgi:hypothetical protein